MLEIVQHKDLFSDILLFKLEKDLQGMHSFPNHFPVTLEKRKQLVPSTLNDQNTNLAAHVSLQTSQLPATWTHSFLLGFSITPTRKFKQLFFSIMEILNTSPVCLTSALQHYL